MLQQSLLRIGLWAALVPAVFLFGESQVNAQKLRGPGGGMGMMTPPTLLPRQPYFPYLLNNGSLQTTQNPNANLPNQVRFIYIAAMPLGDRLGNNGVYYDTDIIPNIGLFQGGQNLMGQVPQNPMNPNPNPNPFPPPFPPNPFQAARMARQRMMMAMYAQYMMQMQQAMMMQAYGDPSGMGWYDPNGTAGYPSMNTGGFGGNNNAPMNNAGFGAGFRNVGGGF